MSVGLGDVASDGDVGSYADGGVAGEGFSPASIPGLILWLDADYGVTITGSGVSSWLDRSTSAANLVQATDANRPTVVAAAVNGHAAIRTNDSSDVIKDTAKPVLDNLTGLTTFVVCNYAGVTGALNWPPSTPAGAGWGGVSGSHYIFGAGGGYHTYNDDALETGWHIYESVYDGTKSTDLTELIGYIDGIAKTLVAGTAIADAYEATARGYALGLAGSSGVGQQETFVIMFNRVLIAAERSKVIDWLGKRYAIAVTLPTSGRAAITLGAITLSATGTVV